MSLVLLFQDAVHLFIIPKSQHLNLQQIDVTCPLTDSILESQKEWERLVPQNHAPHVDSQSTSLAGVQCPRRNLEFSVSFKGTLEFLRVQPPLIAECIALSQTVLQKRYSGGLAASACHKACLSFSVAFKGTLKATANQLKHTKASPCARCVFRLAHCVMSVALNIE